MIEPTDKHLVIDMPDGSRWAVPAHVIAHNRADYYATGAYGGEPGSDGYNKVYQEEFVYTIGDHGELTEWAANQMNWDDVKDRALRCVINPKPADYQEGWMNGEKRIRMLRPEELPVG